VSSYDEWRLRVLVGSGGGEEICEVWRGEWMNRGGLNIGVWKLGWVCMLGVGIR
jgi:hypothetical protein